MEFSRIIYQSLAFITSYASRCAAELEISNHIKSYGSPMPLHELARSISVPPEKELMLDQLMQLLVHQGVYAKSEGGNYMLTPVSELMLTEGSNMGAFVRLFTATLTKEFSLMSRWFKDVNGTGTVFHMANDGKKGFEVLKEQPEMGNMFNEAMASQSKEISKDLAASHPGIFNGVDHLLDVGGGTGTNVKIIADAFPGLKCTVFDLPHVVEHALKSDLFDAVGGDMFDKIPPADAILFKNVLHNWPDKDCVRVLENCKEAIKSTGIDGKVIVVDMILDEEMGDAKATETNLLFSLLMSTIHGSKERTKKEWHDLIMSAGYSGYKIYPARMSFYSVFELYP